jgi:hypothetical protein
MIQILRMYMCIYITSIGMVHACPTCIGIAQSGARPYFEQNGIHYHNMIITLQKEKEANIALPAEQILVYPLPVEKEINKKN